MTEVGSCMALSLSLSLLGMTNLKVVSCVCVRASAVILLCLSAYVRVSLPTLRVSLQRVGCTRGRVHCCGGPHDCSGSHQGTEYLYSIMQLVLNLNVRIEYEEFCSRVSMCENSCSLRMCANCLTCFTPAVADPYCTYKDV